MGEELGVRSPRGQRGTRSGERLDKSPCGGYLVLRNTPPAPGAFLVHTVECLEGWATMWWVLATTGGQVEGGPGQGAGGGQWGPHLKL